MLEESVVCDLLVRNPLGLHTRPATTIVKLLQNCKSDVYFTHQQETVNAKSILSILMLAVPNGATVRVEVIGSDAHETMRLLTESFETGFGEGGGHGH